MSNTIILRPLRGGQGTFDVISKNIGVLLAAHPSVNIKLRINYGADNIEGIGALLSSLPVEWRARLDVVFEQIFGETYGKYSDSIAAQSARVSVERLYLEASSLGYLTTKDTPEMQKWTYCYADRERQFTVNYNGDVFKCTVGKFESRHRLGYLADDGELVLEGERWQQWMGVPAHEDKCKTCVYMPMCMGGCRKVRAIWGDVGADCTLPFAGFGDKLRKRYTSYLEGVGDEDDHPQEARNRLPESLLASGQS